MVKDRKKCELKKASELKSKSKELWWDFQVALVRNLPASAGDLGSILGQEGPLEKGMATHSGVLAWEIPWMEEPGGL